MSDEIESAEDPGFLDELADALRADVDVRRGEIEETPDREAFMKGACHIFADEFHRKFPHLELRRSGVLASDDEGDHALHVYCGLGELMFDVMGERKEQCYHDEKNDGRDAIEIDDHGVLWVDAIEPDAPLKNCWNLHIESGFCLRMRERAAIYIEENLDLYPSLMP